MAARLEHFEVDGRVAIEGGVERSHDDGCAVDAHELEKCDSAGDERHAGIRVDGGEQGRHQRGHEVGERRRDGGAAGEVDCGADDDGEAESEDVAEALGDRAGNLLGHPDGHVVQDAELIDVHDDERRDERGDDALAAHEAGVENTGVNSVDGDNGVGHGEQQHAAHGRDHGRAGVDRLSGRHAAVHGGGE